MFAVRGCVRCGQAADRHPVGRYLPRTGEPSYCLNFMERAPLWMRVLAFRWSR